MENNKLSKIRPTIALYQPPNLRSRTKDFSQISTKPVSFDIFSLNGLKNSNSNEGNNESLLFYLLIRFLILVRSTNKSVLKKSKSFCFTPDPCSLSLIDTEQQVFLKNAIDDPDSLSMTQVMEIVRIICSLAMENFSNSHNMAKICVSIINKAKGKMFLESLINCCREWFNEREKLTRPQNAHHKWPAYIAFVADVYMNIRSKQEQVKLSLINEKAEDHHKIEQSSILSKQARKLAVILFDCCQTLVLTLSISPHASMDIESLLSAMRSVGRYLQEDNEQRMDQLICLIREAFITGSKLSSIDLKCLLEIIEFRASKWQFDSSQQLYYFPYTKIESEN